MRRASRRDDNHLSIVQALRKCGIFVWDTAGLGSGFPDAMTYFRGRIELLEIKNPAKPPSGRRLTPAEEKFKHLFPGTVHVVLTVDDALKAIGASR